MTDSTAGDPDTIEGIAAIADTGIDTTGVDLDDVA